MAVLLAIGACLSIGVYIFVSSSQYFVYAFKPYYIKTYYALAGYYAQNITAFFRHPGAVAALSESATANSIPVLLYHGIIEKNGVRLDGVNTTIDRFIDQMFALKAAGYHTISINDLYSYVRGAHPLPPKSVLITFDDGRKDSYYPADPLLRALGFNVVMFAIGNKTNDSNASKFYLSWHELESMRASGRWDIQSHGFADHDFYLVDATGDKGHFMSNKLWLKDQGRLETDAEFEARLTADLKQSKNLFENRLNDPIASYAFPFSDYGENSVNFPESVPLVLGAAQSVYPMVMIQAFAGTGYTQNYSDPGNQSFVVRRIEPGDKTGAELLARLQNGDAKPLPYHADLAKDEGWSTAWGAYGAGQGTLFVSAASTTGASVNLDGTLGWKNYDMEARLAWPKGSNAYLWTRFKDPGNFAECNFGNNLVHIEQRVGSGDVHVIKGADYAIVSGSSDITLGMRVQGRTVECLVNGAPVVKSDFLDPGLDHGGVGFKVWDHDMDNSEIVVKNLVVTPL